MDGLEGGESAVIGVRRIGTIARRRKNILI